MPDVPDCADLQCGVFSRAQARAEGWSPRQVRRRLEAGRWTAFAGDALCSSEQAIGADQLGWAVVLTWPDAVISHELAGVLRRFPVAVPAHGTATVNRQRGLRARGLVAHRRQLDTQDVGVVRELPTTTSRRTALDLLSSLPWPEARRLWAWTVTRRLLDVAQLEEAGQERAGWHGNPQLRRLAQAGRTGALSEAEDRLHALLRRGGFPGWVANTPIQVGGRVVAVADVLFERAKVVVEIDGYASHSGREAFQRDRARQNALILAGYRVLRFTWQDLTTRPDQVLREIARALRPEVTQ